MQEGIVQDRRQEIVIIGSDLNKEAIIKALDDCLLTKEENVIQRDKLPKSAKAQDIEDNGWKFNWKPKNEEEDTFPTWPDPQRALQDMLGAAFLTMLDRDEGKDDDEEEDEDDDDDENGEDDEDSDED